LPGVAAVLECAAWAQHDGGDHVLFIAEVKRFRAFPDRRPLVFSKGRYAELHQTQFTCAAGFPGVSPKRRIGRMFRLCQAACMEWTIVRCKANWRAEPFRSEGSRRVRGADVARVARSPPAAAAGRASVRAICAVAESCAGTPSTMIAAGKLIDHEASPELSIKPATPRIAVVRGEAGARDRTECRRVRLEAFDRDGRPARLRSSSSRQPHTLQARQGGKRQRQGGKRQM
jgi:Flavin reductase like domain